MKKHILLAEDDADDQLFFTAALKEASPDAVLTVVSAADAALQLLRTSKSLPEICIVDINMPGTSGTDLLKIIRKEERFKGLQIVMLTTSSDRQTAQLCLDLGANGFYSKPETHQLLVKIIAKILSHIETASS